MPNLENYQVGPGSCWTWQGNLNGAGYPSNMEHRKMYEHFYGSVPKTVMLHHRCRRKTCVNPSHMTPVLRNQNVWYAQAERRGQMVRKHLRVARHFHEDMTRRMRALG